MLRSTDINNKFKIFDDMKGKMIEIIKNEINLELYLDDLNHLDLFSIFY